VVPLCSTAQEPAEQTSGAGLTRVALASLAAGDAGEDLFDVPAAAGPGGPAALPADDRSAHGDSLLLGPGTALVVHFAPAGYTPGCMQRSPS